jgi:hypothetical protein
LGFWGFFFCFSSWIPEYKTTEVLAADSLHFRTVFLWGGRLSSSTDEIVVRNSASQVPLEDILHTPRKSSTDHAGLVTCECLESSRPPLH